MQEKRGGGDDDHKQATETGGDGNRMPFIAEMLVF
jgi:hypothetical protein